MRSALLTLLVLAGCRGDAPSRASGDEPAQASRAAGVPFDIEGRLSFVRGERVLKTIDIEIADTDSTRERGLMERSQIPAETGMLFIFETAAPQSFYMASTPKSLDIQFYGPDSTLLNVAEDTTPFSFDTVPSSGPAQFVVEVPAGYSRRIGLVPGDRITWSAGSARAAR